MYSHDWEEQAYERMSKAMKNGDDVEEWAKTSFNLAFSGAAFRGDVEFLKLMKEWLTKDFDRAMAFDRAMDFDRAMELAAENGHIEIVKLMKQWGAREIELAMLRAAEFGHIEIVKLCKKWGTRDLDYPMMYAARNGHVEIVKLCKKWGAKGRRICSFYEDFFNKHLEILKLVRGWDGWDAIHEELLRFHHKRKFFKDLESEIMAVAWHPDRYRDWCLDEEEKESMASRWV